MELQLLLHQLLPKTADSRLFNTFSHHHYASQPIPKGCLKSVSPLYICTLSSNKSLFPPCYTMFYHVIPCHTMLYHVIACFTMFYHVLPCYTMFYHFFLPCFTMFYHGIPCYSYTNDINKWWHQPSQRHNQRLQLSLCYSYRLRRMQGIESIL